VRAGTSITAAVRHRLLTVLGLTALALLPGLAAAGPAAAIDDATRPDARVTHGPSCRPGGVVVEVVAGTAPYAVVLATTRSPGGEDSAEVAPGGTVVLRTGDVAWGETIDGRLEYTALDASGTDWVDELEGYTFTRPAEEDCAAITAPAAAATVPGSAPDAAPAVPDPAGDAGPARVIEPGGPPSAIGAVDVATAAAAPVAERSLAPVLLATVALGAAGAGLVGATAAGRLRRRTPTAGA
jgi:hypothetical protein